MKIEFENKKTRYRLILFLLGVVGLVIQFVTDGLNVVMYYTILSNLLVTFFLLYLIRRKTAWDNKLYRIKGGVTMAIMITFAVYHFLLSPTIEAKDFYTIENFICHYIVPLGFFLDTMILDKGRYEKYDPILWTLFPLGYSIFALFNGLVLKIPIPSPDSPFPYFFVNVTKYGWVAVLKYSAGILVGYLLFGYVFYFLKNKINSKMKE
ncbi:MAG: Pr6Pr family membrane protein [Peptostreptococcaceae bacterium]|nr:Pr6Pr family membrane protein [Peptostreptococcaceae bacterium]